jgi:4-hydroxy-tetrahydrodipicolinate synthase
MKEPGRLITAMVTPFKEDGSVDYRQAQKLAVKLIDSGSDGVVVVGTTGESPTLVRSEELKLFAAIKEAIGGRGSIIAGTGSNATAEAVETTIEAENIGVDACLLVVPYYNKPSQEGLYQHFKKVAQSTRLPCILYNVPSRTVASLSAETTIRLSQIENIIGIKEASGNFEEISRIISSVRPDFRVWSGNDSDTLPMMALGAYGVISVVSHLVGRQIKAMIEHCLKGEMVQAACLHNQLMPVFKTMFITANPCPLKYALNYLGFNVGKPRLPLVEPDEKSAEQIRQVLAATSIDLPIH